MTEMYGANTEPDQQDQDDAAAGRKVIDIRVGQHDKQRFDRVVIDLSGDGKPGYYAAYVDEASTPGEGALIVVPGDAILLVAVRGVDWTADTPAEYGQDPVDLNGRSVAGVRWGGTFEGQTDLYIGTTSRLPFRVGRVDDPTRLYIDIAQSL